MIPDENKNEAYQKKVETKYKDPNRLDKATYGQIWKVIGEEDKVTVWVQASKIEDDPKWINITAFFDEDVQILLCDPEFRSLMQVTRVIVIEKN